MNVWKNMEEIAVTANGTRAVPVSDVVELAASINPAAVTKYHSDQVLTLNESLTVSGSSTFYADFTDGIGESGATDEQIPILVIG